MGCKDSVATGRHRRCDSVCVVGAGVGVAMSEWLDDEGEPRPERKDMTPQEGAGCIALIMAVLLLALVTAGAIIARVAMMQLPR